VSVSTGISCDVVLVGGGHSHALFLRQWALNPLPGVQLTLISRDVLTPYSGMLPGYVAGHYSYEDIHIDLQKLCAWAGVRFIERELTAIDLDKRTLKVNGHPDVLYDLLLLDTGSTPLLNVPGAATHTTPVKPVYSFIDRWKNLQETDSTEIGVVGAGAGGFELTMAMAHRLRDKPINIHWFIRGEKAMSDRPPKVGKLAVKHARKAGVPVHLNFDVDRVESNCVYASDGRSQQFQQLLWCTAATAPEWPRVAGLEVDDRGFVATNDYLQSRSNPDVFATGDIGTQVENPSAKAGVFAVRQAPFLFHNVQAKISNKPLRAFVPQTDFLSLVSTGKKHAIGSRNGVTFSGGWVWKLKHHIDQSFMKKFIDLPLLQGTGIQT